MKICNKCLSRYLEFGLDPKQIVEKKECEMCGWKYNKFSGKDKREEKTNV